MLLHLFPDNIFKQKNCMKRPLFVLFCLLAVLLNSCENESEDFVLRELDKSLVGSWKKEYITKDFHNQITCYSEYFIFGDGHSGENKIYKFDQLDHTTFFSYYTENNRLFLRFDDNKDKIFKWDYSIQDDSLYINGFRKFVRE